MNEIKIPVILELYKTGKIGFKRAWLMSGLSFPNFAHLLNENDIDPHISESLEEKMFHIADSFPLEKVKRKQNQT